MAELHPGWVNGINAFEARLATGMFTSAHQKNDALDPLRVRSGIRDAPGDPGQVTLGTNKVTVNPFQAVIQDPSRPALGPYLVTMDGPKELPLTAADPSRGRIDLVIAEVDPDVDPGFTVRLVQGEPGTPPQRPTVTNPLHLELAEILVPRVGNAPTRTDKRQFTSALGGILRIPAGGSPPAGAPDGMFIYRLEGGILQVRKGDAWVTYRPPRGSVDTWHTATLKQGWTNLAGWPLAGYTITEDGWVRLRGVVGGGALTDPIFDPPLPAGHRPTARQMFAVASSDAFGRLDVLPDGKVMAMKGGSWFSLFNVAFATY